MATPSRPAFLSGNALKLIAAASMLIDHAGLMLLPQLPLLRVLGRLAFPIFAFMIAEGCHYTRSRRKYFLSVFSLALVCQLVYYFFDGSMYLSILVSFSLSILTIYALRQLKQSPSVLTGAVFAAAVAAVYAANRCFTIDYGFWGCMVPVLAAVPQGTKYDSIPIRSIMLSLGLTLLALDMGGNQYFALLAVPLLLLYSGKRGKYKMKYFFYIFYPLHLALLQGIAFLVG